MKFLISMKILSYLRVALLTTVNIVLDAVTVERYVWLEERIYGDIFSNWVGRFRYRPQEFVQPTTEEEIVKLVKKSEGLRVFGSGHSFNNGVVSDETLVSLDKYSGPVHLEGPKEEPDSCKGRYTCKGLRWITYRTFCWRDPRLVVKTLDYRRMEAGLLRLRTSDFPRVRVDGRGSTGAPGKHHLRRARAAVLPVALPTEDDEPSTLIVGSSSCGPACTFLAGSMVEARLLQGSTEVFG